jgi:hypothetical protein
MRKIILTLIVLTLYSCSPKYKNTGVIIEGKHHVLVGGNWRKMQFRKLNKESKKKLADY